MDRPPALQLQLVEDVPPAAAPPGTAQAEQLQQHEPPVRDLKLAAVHQLSLFDWDGRTNG